MVLLVIIPLKRPLDPQDHGVPLDLWDSLGTGVLLGLQDVKARVYIFSAYVYVFPCLYWNEAVLYVFILPCLNVNMFVLDCLYCVFQDRRATQGLWVSLANRVLLVVMVLLETQEILVSSDLVDLKVNNQMQPFNKQRLNT